MKTSTFISNPLTVVLTVLLLSFLFLQQAVGQNFPSSASEAGIVLNGRITSKTGTWSSDRSTIYTVNWIRPSAIFHGSALQDSIPVLTKGGLTDEGFLVVSHSLEFQPSNDYLLALEPCHDCVEGMTAYLPMGAIADFNRGAYQLELNKWRSSPRMGRSFAPCDAEDAVLHLSFGNVHLTQLGQSVSGYLDILTKTEQSPKTLHSISSEVAYATNVFGTYAINSQSISIVPIGSGMASAYTTASSDIAQNKAAFSMVKNPFSTQWLVVNDFYQSSIRLSFVTSAANLQNLPSELSELFTLEGISASYYCDGREYAFDRIIIDKNTIGVVVEGLESSIEYYFEGAGFFLQAKPTGLPLLPPAMILQSCAKHLSRLTIA